MLETRAIIIQLDGQDAVVEGKQGGGCGNCDSKNGCGSVKLSQIFGSRSRNFRVHNSIDARIGDEVLVSVADGALLRSALIMYMLPLGLLMAGGFFGVSLGEDSGSRDAYAVIGASIGLVTGFVLARFSSFSAPQPIISRYEREHSSCSSSR